MDINTGKLASSSLNFIKHLKENDSNNKLSKVDTKEKDIKSLLSNDLLEIKSDDREFKNRLNNINQKVSNFENELSKVQYVEQQVSIIDGYLKSNDLDKIYQVIENSTFNNEKVLKAYFNDDNNIKNVVETVKEIINEKLNDLNKDYNEIEITTQNIISLYTYSPKSEENIIKNSNENDLLKSTQISNKRVMDLIS